MIKRLNSHFAMVLSLCIIILNFASQGHCQLHQVQTVMAQDFEPWEAEDLKINPESLPALPNPGRLPKSIGLGLIRWYQKSIATRSIQRCPFFPSCSNFAVRAIQEHGLLVGICLFIDRNLYRENRGIYQLYNLIEASDGSLKLDDRYFINGNR